MLETDTRDSGRDSLILETDARDMDRDSLMWDADTRDRDSWMLVRVVGKSKEKTNDLMSMQIGKTEGYIIYIYTFYYLKLKLNLFSLFRIATGLLDSRRQQ